ncbi:hypothetical protein INR49_029198, partial [Caranx melampygus]
MIATGGLLRINARRQDSLKSKPHKPHTHKKKNKKKKRSEVVVVKGKLKLCSVSGLVAAVGILVLLAGVVMAALGYWPRDGLFFSSQSQESTAMASVSSVTSTPAPAGTQLQGDGGDDRGGGDKAASSDERWGGGGDGERYNQTETFNRTAQQPPRGFLEDFLDRYLYSDRLKVFGPLIMGIGIFLFICANAVLHENRDKKTKVINLRDIYSTVIDLHSLRRPNNSSSAHNSSNNPLNGLVNYVQSKSLESKTRVYPTSMMNRREGGDGEEGGGMLSKQHLLTKSRGDGGGNDGEEDAVFSIFQEHPDVPPALSSSPTSHRLSLPPCFSPPSHSACCTPHRRSSAHSPYPCAIHALLYHTGDTRLGRGRTGPGRKEGEEGRRGPFQENPSVLSCSSSSFHRKAAGGSQALLLLSSSTLTHSQPSLSSLSHLSSLSMTAPPCRRHSLPLGSITAGYSKLMHGEDESFESTEITSSHHVTSQASQLSSEEVTSQRRYSKMEKLRMISQ